MTVALTEQITEERPGVKSSYAGVIPIPPSRPIWDTLLNNSAKQRFFYKALLQALDAYENGHYSDFDAHTTTNCCHGIAVLVRDLITKVQHIDLQNIRLDTLKYIHNPIPIPSSLPNAVIDLTSLYVLHKVRHVDSKSRLRTNIHLLKKIEPLGTQFCTTLTHELRRHISNTVADRYALYLEASNSNTQLCGAYISSWGEFVKTQHIRTDKRSIKYASCIYSTQVCLGYAIENKIPIALVCDLIHNNKPYDQYIQLFISKNQQLEPISMESLALLELSDYAQPALAFGGYAHCPTKRAYATKIHPWIYQLPSLIMAGDVNYPQFPLVNNDSLFDGSPIFPENEQLQRLLSLHGQISGVCTNNPSLFLSTHNYPVSLRQIFEAQNSKNKLPNSYWNIDRSPSIPWTQILFNKAPA